MRVVPPVEGRFQRWGKWAEYDNWLEQHRSGGAPRSAARPRSRRSAWARRSRSRSTSTTGPTTAQSGTVDARRCRPASRPTRRRKPYGPLAPGADTTVNFTRHEHVHEHDAARRRDQRPGHDRRCRTSRSRITTTYSTPAPRLRGPDARRSSRRRRSRRRPPRRSLDGAEGAGEYTGAALDIGRKWEPAAHARLRAGRRRLRHRRAPSAARRQHLRQGHPLRRRTCTSSSTSATTSSPTRSRPTSASRTGWRTRSRS